MCLKMFFVDLSTKIPFFLMSKHLLYIFEIINLKYIITIEYNNE